MKSIIYSLIAIFIFGIIAVGFTNKSNTTHRILLQTNDSKISSVNFAQSIEIITNRLKSFSSEKFDINAFPDKNQIQVILTDDWDLKLAENLLTQKGRLEFYETYNYISLTKLLKNDDVLLTLLHEKAPYDSSANMGCASPSEVHKVNEYLNSLGLNNQCKFVWSTVFDNSNVCLYALRLNNGNGIILRGTDIESFKFKNDTEGKRDYIEFKIKKSAIGLWSDITKRNINNAIAIILDNNLIYAPVIRSEIKGGKCQLSNNFTQDQLKYIAAIGDNGELPLSFKIVK